MSAISKAIATRNDAADRNLDAATDYARTIAVSELLPEAYRGKPANVLVASEYGRSVGIDPITAMQMVHIIKGKPTASAQLVGALVRRAGHRLRVTWDGTTATAEIVRADDDTFTFRAEWTAARAQAAGLMSNPTYKNHLPAMLKARAITEVSRDACPEALAGISHTAEEIDGPSEVVAAQVQTPEVTVTDQGVVATETGELIDAEIVEEP
jgi:hypothetical protein